ncbi:MAG: adenosylcobinamide-phosphate synthase [Clostridiales bacterium]|nr:adenosylcobinamide-phosphate synthase [Clostridiales bacterium]
MLKWILFAILLDWIIGDPPTWPHPVRVFGWWIRVLEKFVRAVFKNLYIGGGMLWFFAVSVPMLILYIFSITFPPILWTAFSIYLMFTSLAAKCMKDEAYKVKRLLDNNALSESQKELGYLVGRDTANLTKPQVLRGIIETVSENTIDGILAPLFYMLIGAPFGLSVYFAVAYKVINTLDSTIGYMQAPYKEIGFVSAKIDDLANYIPARLGAILMLVAGGLVKQDLKNGWYILKRDCRNHKSPNCGFPEAVTAGLLRIQLGGTNTYFGEVVVKPTIGDAVKTLETTDIEKSIRVLYVAEVLLMLLAIVINLL